MTGRWIRPNLVLGLALGWLGTAALQGQPGAPTQAFTAPDWGSMLPSGTGRDYTRALCSNCHSVGVIMIQTRSGPQWQSFLRGMNAARRVSEICACIGGPLNAEEIGIISSYLGEAFGRRNPVRQLPLNINTAPARALSLLPGLEATDIETILAHRAGNPFTSKAGIEELLGREKFRRIEPFVDVRDSNFRRDGFLPM